ncbi:MAG: class I SAM-dependent methyltransferase [Bilifractor sp.]|jgi:ubiquinone/menaquinone biosynthesis C-methylase UbiE
MMNNAEVTGQLWDELAGEWYARKRKAGVYQKMMDNPDGVFHPEVREMLGDLKGRKVCVVGTGDNVAALALARLGAEVTAVDLSEQIVRQGRAVARELKVPVTMVCADAMNMQGVPDQSFDLVYTSNGFLTFLSDLPAFLSEVQRILKPGGFYLLFDVHPCLHPFGGYTDRLILKKDYDEIGPFTQALVWHWRTEDIINAIAGQHQMRIVKMRELKALPGTFWNEFIRDPEALKKAKDPKINPLWKLPQWIVVLANRESVS